MNLETINLIVQLIFHIAFYITVIWGIIVIVKQEKKVIKAEEDIKIAICKQKAIEYLDVIENHEQNKLITHKLNKLIEKGEKIK